MKWLFRRVSFVVCNIGLNATTQEERPVDFFYIVWLDHSCTHEHRRDALNLFFLFFSFLSFFFFEWVSCSVTGSFPLVLPSSGLKDPAGVGWSRSVASDSEREARSCLCAWCLLLLAACCFLSAWLCLCMAWKRWEIEDTERILTPRR